MNAGKVYKLDDLAQVEVTIKIDVHTAAKMVRVADWMGFESIEDAIADILTEHPFDDTPPGEKLDR